MSDNVKQISYDELSGTINSNPLTHPNRLAVLGMFLECHRRLLTDVVCWI